MGITLTRTICIVLWEMARKPDDEWYGGELYTATRGISNLYATLRQLRDEGMVTSRVEDPAESTKRAGPPRTYYRLTDAGRALTREAAVYLG